MPTTTAISLLLMRKLVSGDRNDYPAPITLREAHMIVVWCSHGISGHESIPGADFDPVPHGTISAERRIAGITNTNKPIAESSNCS